MFIKLRGQSHTVRLGPKVVDLTSAREYQVALPAKELQFELFNYTSHGRFSSTNLRVYHYGISPLQASIAHIFTAMC
jgi:hypothetical protein